MLNYKEFTHTFRGNTSSYKVKHYDDLRRVKFRIETHAGENILLEYQIN